MLESFKADYFHYTGKPWRPSCFYTLFTSQTLRYVYFGRQSAEARFFKKIGGVQKLIGRHMGNEIGWDKIGKGLVLAHPYGITVSAGATIGENCVLFKGCTVGGVRGNSKIAGAPTIGDRVVVCCNAMVCGGIRIGNDVLIAAGAFVDFNVPDNSIVVGNPGVIHHKENPTRYYT